MKRPYLPLPAVQAATTKILTPRTDKILLTHEYFDPQKLPARYGNIKGTLSIFILEAGYTINRMGESRHSSHAECLKIVTVWTESNSMKFDESKNRLSPLLFISPVIFNYILFVAIAIGSRAHMASYSAQPPLCSLPPIR